MSRFGEVLRKVLRSWAGVVFPPRSSWGITLSVEEGKEGFSSEVSSRGCNAAAEGAWKARREVRTAWIWVASSLQAHNQPTR